MINQSLYNTRINHTINVRDCDCAYQPRQIVNSEIKGRNPKNMCKYEHLMFCAFANQKEEKTYNWQYETYIFINLVWAKQTKDYIVIIIISMYIG